MMKITVTILVHRKAKVPGTQTVFQHKQSKRCMSALDMIGTIQIQFGEGTLATVCTNPPFGILNFLVLTESSFNPVHPVKTKKQLHEITINKKTILVTIIIIIIIITYRSKPSGAGTRIDSKDEMLRSDTITNANDVESL